jgi:predicted RNA methylase
MLQEILKQCSVKKESIGFIVLLPEIQLERKMYLEVAKKLEDIGCKWNRKYKGFLYELDPSEYLFKIQDGEKINTKKEIQFYPTPENVARYLIRSFLSEITIDKKVLEPSAGRGALIKTFHIYNNPNVIIDYCEINELNKEYLKKLPNANFLQDNFLELNRKNFYDVIIANPPFSKNQDIDHFYKMWECLKEGGVILSIMSKHWLISSNKKESDFKAFLEKNNYVSYPLKQGDFKESGTNIEAIIIKIEKPVNIMETENEIG